MLGIPVFQFPPKQRRRLIAASIWSPILSVPGKSYIPERAPKEIVAGLV
jgi:hypothetical protein